MAKRREERKGRVGGRTAPPASAAGAPPASGEEEAPLKGGPVDTEGALNIPSAPEWVYAPSPSRRENPPGIA